MNLVSIIERYRDTFEQRYATRITPDQRHAIRAMLSCRSGNYGFTQLECPDCQWHYQCPLACGHRFCHRCQHHDTRQWLDKQTQKLLPVNYYMVTFTLPSQLRSLAYNHQRDVYRCLFDCAVSTVRDFVANDKHLRAQAGMTAVLHTHSRRLNFHPHIHLVVPAGGFVPGRNLWTTKPGKYLFNQRALARVFSARLCQALTDLGYPLPADLPEQWIVDCQHVGRGLPALKYLSRYLYRGVISERNIIDDDGTYVSFRYQCSQTGRWKTRTLEGTAFLWLLFQHVLPKRFRRVRDYGFLHGNAKRKLTLLQLVLRVRLDIPQPISRAPFLCQLCQTPMTITGVIKPGSSSG